MPKKKKAKTKVQKPMSSGTPNYKQKSQYDVEKEIKPDKIVAKDIFDGVSKKSKSKSKKKKTKKY
tara:strand:- start:1356 stop:1550 length:195 start_codon:yes stop_codon:yes gene_type:complete